jgi:hypothetical protein
VTHQRKRKTSRKFDRLVHFGKENAISVLVAESISDKTQQKNALFTF